jgi:hypothetical protein
MNRCHLLSLHAPKSASLRPFAFQIETEGLPLVRAWARVWTLTPTPLHRSPDTTLFIWLRTGLCKEIGTLNQPLNAKKAQYHAEYLLHGIMCNIAISFWQLRKISMYISPQV